MATLFSDDFNRANSDNLGANWTELPGSSNQNTAAINTNRLRLVNADITDPYFIYQSAVHTNTTSHAAVADCKATITRITGASFDGGPLVRKQSGADTYYYLDVNSDGTISVYRRNAGAETLIGNRDLTNAANDIYSLQVTGTGATVTLKIFINAVQDGTDLTDTNGSRIVGAGHMGVLSWSNTVSCDFDDFLAESVVTAVGPVFTLPVKPFLHLLLR